MKADGCWKCGRVDFWFDRELMEPCGSMHYVCDSCGALQSCGHVDCLYGVVRVRADKEADDEVDE